MTIFEGIDLNDSFVISWEQSPNSVVFNLEVSIWPSSMYYLPPKPNEYTCYRKGTLTFANVISCSGLKAMSEVVPATDASGDIDFGNIDKLITRESGFTVIGDFGDVAIVGGELRLEIGM